MKSSVIVNIVALAATGCVSVNIGPQKPKRAEGVQYAEPARPFETDGRKDVDAAWKNPRNGNLISYLSECQDADDPALDSIVQDALGGLSDLKVESDEAPMFEGRAARRVSASGRVDGVPSKIDLLVFKRNRCIYLLTYVGVPKDFSVDHSKFNAFITGFRAP